MEKAPYLRRAPDTGKSRNTGTNRYDTYPGTREEAHVYLHLDRLQLTLGLCQGEQEIECGIGAPLCARSTAESGSPMTMRMWNGSTGRFKRRCGQKLLSTRQTSLA